MREAGGFRMGPFELMDMIGHDVNFAVTNSVWRSFFHDPRFLPSLLQQERVDAGHLGRKSGRGFYDYRDGAARPVPNSEPAQPAPAKIALFGESTATIALAAHLAATGIACERPAASDGRIAEADGAVLYVTDGRSATRRAAESGCSDTVLIDLALDFGTATRIAIAAAVDVAMCLGVNYPRGPLAWADSIGLPAVRDVLANLGAAYGEDRYRTSPLFHQMVFARKKFHD
jgi:3-hydroxybutyryl-CoA dehydrogenase